MELRRGAGLVQGHHAHPMGTEAFGESVVNVTAIAGGEGGIGHPVTVAPEIDFHPETRGA